ncbi:MAG TPA: GGDEF domain-containing protein, partial [Armatimonadetes bacterium]|nr:GGDEF domain-containing protein [Armatimonadota bacterium]
EDALANWLVRYTAPIINTAGTVGELYFFGDGRDFPPGRKQRVTAQIAAYAASVIERVASLFALERVIWTDPLTGLVNRQCWLAKADEELARARRVHLPVSVVLIDLDGFKAINDYLGHAKGDEVLKRVGSAMRRRVRRYDVVARLGGDEFALLLPATPPSGAMVVAERMRNLIEEMDMSKILGCSVQLTASVGTATGPAAGETPDELLEAADRALREAKTSGKNRVVQDKGSQSVEEVAWSNVSLLFDTRLVRLFVNRICHEVNNPAQGILGLVELLLDDPDLELHMQAREDLKKIEELVLRLRDLTRKLANASHGELVKYAQEFAEMVRRMTPPEKARVIDDVN